MLPKARLPGRLGVVVTVVASTGDADTRLAVRRAKVRRPALARLRVVHAGRVLWQAIAPIGTGAFIVSHLQLVPALARTSPRAQPRHAALSDPCRRHANLLPRLCLQPARAIQRQRRRTLALPVTLWRPAPTAERRAAKECGLRGLVICLGVVVVPVVPTRGRRRFSSVRRRWDVLGHTTSGVTPLRGPAGRMQVVHRPERVSVLLPPCW
mmetsp:Transcript_11803/g.41331  ORF Transcript_11803/g.41331 Transcript_11803/m.41331 type:complete len:210 (-) Transcript_11803:234-863(-)